MIWNGTDPLQPDHEVAYRGWPTERVSFGRMLIVGKLFSVPPDNIELTHIIRRKDGTARLKLGAWLKWRDKLDLIPLQQEPAK